MFIIMDLNKLKLHGVLLFSLLSCGMVVATEHDKEINSWPIFDAHIHYSHDVWDAISPTDAIRRLRALGIKRIL